jgi:hypothetical protein
MRKQKQFEWNIFKKSNTKPILLYNNCRQILGYMFHVAKKNWMRGSCTIMAVVKIPNKLPNQKLNV